MQELLSKATTAQLIEMSLALATATDADQIYVSTMIDRELEGRMPEADFIAHMNHLEAMLDAA